MIYEVAFHIPGTVKINVDSPEEAKEMVEAMDAAGLAPFLESTVVDNIRGLPPEEAARAQRE
ncbi:unnamed protein product [marine sediment metagenome]|uniref:Uncharacterized protein n=1 Tax=marine sediment metagenome TaxID=412755 RepID=X1TE31_9ZZZZ